MMAELRREYLAEAPSRLEALAAAVEHYAGGGADGADGVRRLLHQLAGSAGSYGFEAASALSRELEQWMRSEPPPTADAAERLRAGVRELGTLLGR